MSIHGIQTKDKEENIEVEATKEQEDAINESFNRIKMLKKQGSNGSK